jgi:hypothetical protein
LLKVAWGHGMHEDMSTAASVSPKLPDGHFKH